MNRLYLVLSYSSLALLGFFGLAQPVWAQVASDTTLPRPSRVIVQGDRVVITDGTEVGRNLFHSFREFSVPDRITASFQGVDRSVTNIFARVTGSNASRINGRIETLGQDGQVSPANLFLLNPNGILFGTNASLNIGGSFLATTADRINFADGTSFGSNLTQTSPLLTVSAPVGLQFGNNPGRIVNQSRVDLVDGQGTPVLLDLGDTSFQNVPGGLQVRPRQSIALIGGTISMRGGAVTAAGGSIELSSIASSGEVKLISTDLGWRFDYADIRRFGVINLSQEASIDTSGYSMIEPEIPGGGAIHLQAAQLRLTGGAQVFSDTEGTESGADVRINATESIDIDGVNTFFATGTRGVGDAGNLRISTSQLTISNAGSIFSDTSGGGQGGSIIISAPEGVILRGAIATAESYERTSLLTFSNALATGRAGDIKVSTRRLSILDGAELGSITSGSNRGGDVSINASDRIQVTGAFNAPNQGVEGESSLLFSQSSCDQDCQPQIGRAGNIRIQTNRLQVEDGSSINSTTFSDGRSGDITIHATEINLSGIRLRSNGQPLFAPKTRINYPSGIFASADLDTSGNGGTIRIFTDRLEIRAGAVLQTSTFGSGNAGNLLIHATESVNVRGTSINQLSGGLPGTEFLSVPEATGAGGNLQIQTPFLRVADGAAIAVSSINPQAPRAGQLDIRSRTIQLNNGLLTARTESGNGASIRIQQTNALLMNRRSEITTSAGQERGGGTGGNIDINANFLVASPFGNNDITANAIRQNGGNVNIQANAIGITSRSLINPERSPQSEITATSQQGISGNIRISNIRVDPIQGLIILPNTFLDRSQQIAQSCSPQFTQNRFIVTGRGGIPLSPDQVLRSPNTLSPDWITLHPESNTAQTPNHSSSRHLSTVTTPEDSSQSELVEATGWTRNAQNQVQLIARSPVSLTATIPTCASD
jgi:filamentous hemagglutinin family protein